MPLDDPADLHAESSAHGARAAYDAVLFGDLGSAEAIRYACEVHETPVWRARWAVARAHAHLTTIGARRAA